jgi:hypothetical protein
LSARHCGALLHACHTVMPGAAAGVQDLRVDALSVVTDAQSEPPLIVMDLHFDPLRLGVSGVGQVDCHRLTAMADRDPLPQ